MADHEIDTGPAERAASEAASLPPVATPAVMLEWAKEGVTREKAHDTATPTAASGRSASPAMDVSGEVGSLLAGLPGGQGRGSPPRCAVDAEVDALFAEIGLNLRTMSDDESPDNKE